MAASQKAGVRQIIVHDFNPKSSSSRMDDIATQNVETTGMTLIASLPAAERRQLLAWGASPCTRIV
jgi:hypothetical protein